MSEYSERSKELAQKLGEKAARNLQRSGKVVERSSTGQYTVKNPDSKSRESRSSAR